MTQLHKQSIIIDGLIVAKWHRPVFEAMHAGGITAANCTVAFWENFQGTVNNIVSMNRDIEDNQDILSKAHSTDDILQAKKANKTGVILGFQNAHPLEDNLGYVQVFKDLGVGVIQMAYNTQNLICTGCYETDKGLSDYGREVVAEMNRVGVLCDLSHVGAQSSKDVILASSMPVCYSHCLPAGLKAHPRNKSDEDLRFIAKNNGFIGVTMFPPFLEKGINSTIDDYVKAIEYIINLVGEDNVGIGTDFTQDQDRDFFDHITRDKGQWRKLTEFGEIINPKGIRSLHEFPNITDACLQAGWSEGKVEKIMGQNWFKLLKQVWLEN